MKKNVIILMLFTILSKTFGFLREIILANAYGASNISDAYLISQTIPITILSFIGMGIATSYIPMYSNIVRNKSIEIADEFTSNLINFILIVCTVIIFIVLLFADPLVRLFAAGFQGDTLRNTIIFTRITIFGIYFSGITYVFSSYLNIKNNFIIPALLGIPFNFFMIASIEISKIYNITILPIGCVIAAIFQLLLLIPYAYKYGYRYCFVLNRKDKYLKSMIHLSIPVIIGVSVNQINVLVDRTLASLVVTGGISALSYGNRLIQLINDVFIISIATVIFPKMTEMVNGKKINELKKCISQSIIVINLLVIPIMVGTMIFAKPIVRLLFGRGAFDAQAISKTASVMFFYALGLFAYGVREIESRAFYSFQDTKTPMINATIALVLNIILNIILSKFFGIGGLALATSISAIICMILLSISLRKKIGSFYINRIIISSSKILCASLTMGLISKVSYTLLINNININLSLVLSVTIGIFIYFAIIHFMHIEEMELIINTIKEKINKNHQ